MPHASDLVPVQRYSHSGSSLEPCYPVAASHGCGTTPTTCWVRISWTTGNQDNSEVFDAIVRVLQGFAIHKVKF